MNALVQERCCEQRKNQIEEAFMAEGREDGVKK